MYLKKKKKNFTKDSSESGYLDKIGLRFITICGNSKALTYFKLF